MKEVAKNNYDEDWFEDLTQEGETQLYTFKKLQLVPSKGMGQKSHLKGRKDVTATAQSIFLLFLLPRKPKM